MRRGAKPAKPKLGAKLSVARKTATDEDQRVRDVEKRLAEALQREAEALKRETEALERQTATSEILRVISSSPTDVRPVFAAIARSAAGLCEAELSAVYRYDGELIHVVANTLRSSEQRDAFARLYTMPPSRGTQVAWAVLESRTQNDRHTQKDHRYHVLY